MGNFRFFALAIFGLLPGSLWANWGSIAGGSVATGNFRSNGTEQVEMLKENLLIRLYRDRAKVEVDYVLRNTGPAIDVRAGFPSLGAQNSEHKHLEIEEYVILADGKPVPVVHEKGDPAPLKALYDAKFLRMIDTTDEDPSTPDQNLLLDWLVSTVHFASGESKRVHISYESLYAYCTGGFSDDSDTCDHRFAYVLSTGAAWKGPIGEGHITIEPVSVDVNRILISPKGKFVRSKDTFIWEFRDLKPTMADNIVVSMNNAMSSIASYEEGAGERGFPNINYYAYESGRYFYLTQEFKASGASAGADFGPEQVRSQDSDRGWRTAHSPGIGDALTLTLTKPIHIDQVGVVPGCGKDKTEWLSHARIKDVEVTVNGSQMRATRLSDEYFPSAPGWDESYHWVNLPAYTGDAKEIRLTIRSVYPGANNQVTCMSGVMLRRWLPFRPKVRSGIDDHMLP